MSSAAATTFPAARLTITGARKLASDAPSGATYWSAFDNGVEVDRGHTPASKRCWDMDSIIEHLEQGHRIELRTGAALTSDANAANGSSVPAYVLEGIQPGCRAAI